MYVSKDFSTDKKEMSPSREELRLLLELHTLTLAVRSYALLYMINFVSTHSQHFMVFLL